MKYECGVTGQLISGHVLDTNKPAIEQALKDYDGQLYVKWNPRKMRGWGCWEIRRRPIKKSIADYAIYNNNAYIKVDYVELDLVNHVLDLPYLNFLAVEKIQKMDAWKSKDWAHQLERTEQEQVSAMEDKIREDRAYAAKQHKREINEFKELLRSGFNPNEIARYWNKA